jgi:hypothetical protein
VALAPSIAMKGPVMLRAPSYVKSENKLATPIRITNFVATDLEIFEEARKPDNWLPISITPITLSHPDRALLHQQD